MKALLKKTSKVVIINPLVGSPIIAAKDDGYDILEVYSARQRGRITALANHDFATAPKYLLNPRPVVQWESVYDPAMVALVDSPTDDELFFALRLGARVVVVDRRAPKHAIKDCGMLGAMLGYYYYRIKYNIATFGVPQWRQRVLEFWIERTARHNLLIYHDPTKVVVGDVLFSDMPVRAPCRCAAPCVMLDPGLVAPALSAKARWSVDHGHLFDAEMMEIAGYPTGYDLEEVDGLAFSDRVRSLLSAGTPPAVWRWAIEMIERNLYHPRSFHKLGRGEALSPCAFAVAQPGGYEAASGSIIEANLAPSFDLWSRWGE